MSVPKQTEKRRSDNRGQPKDLWLSEDESRDEFDRYARAVTGLSGPEFLKRLGAGEFTHVPDDPEHRELMSLVTWASLGR